MSENKTQTISVSTLVKKTLQNSCYLMTYPRNISTGKKYSVFFLLCSVLCFKTTDSRISANDKVCSFLINLTVS